MSTHLVLVGGFLGAGKTTTLLRLAQQWTAQQKRVAIITNDQADDLVDTDTFRAAGLDAAEVAGGCFCCRFDDFIARADSLMADVRPDVILAEPVGSCTDIVATVINPLRQMYPDRFSISRYPVVVDPVRALKVLGRTEPVGLSERIIYIYRMQQQEADAIAINKIDLLTDDDRRRVVELVREHVGDRQILLFSALTGEGFDALVEWLGAASDEAPRPLRDIDYDVYAAGENELAWLNGRIRLEGSEPISLDDALLDLVKALSTAFAEQQVEVAHGKVMIAADGRMATANLVDSATPPQLSRRAETQATAVLLTANLRVATAPVTLDGAFHWAVSEWADRHHLTVMGGGGQTIAPPRPVPTHRLTDIP
jgi:Ni2+-binding GTPase involved in maturation of urease and hydrogenase